ncbi:MAG TPA: hypothetical protein VFQ35_24330 [Polyangiaceae bacterium]|nr:hypothetical protein [Polyangiaceae bacterium]
MPQSPKFARLIASLLAAGVLFACSGDGLGDSSGSVCPTDSALTYENFGQNFMNTYCVACHASKESPHLGTVEQVRAHIGEIDRAAASGPKATNTYMPEGGSVPTEERQKLGEWLACGAP